MQADEIIFLPGQVNKNTGKKEVTTIIVEKKTPLDTILQERSIIFMRMSSGIFT
jgi:hypothetical protein